MLWCFRENKNVSRIPRGHSKQYNYLLLLANNLRQCKNQNQQIFHEMWAHLTRSLHFVLAHRNIKVNYSQSRITEGRYGDGEIIDASTRAINRMGKNEDPQLTVRTEKTMLVRYFLYLHYVHDWFRNHFYIRGLGKASNF